MRICLVIACLLVAGCSTTWYHKNFSQARFDRDVNQCEVEANARAGYGLITVLAAYQQIYTDCMKRKGYTLDPPEETVETEESDPDDRPRKSYF